MTKNQRLAVFALLLAILLALFLFAPTSPDAPAAISSVLFTSLLLISFSALLLEPYFSRPTDVIAAGTSILLLLVPSRSIFSSWGPWYWLYGAYVLSAVLLSAVALLLLSDTKSPTALHNRLSALLKTLVTRLAPGKVQYFALFLLTLLFFVPPASPSFVALALYGVVVVLLEPQRLGTVLPQTVRRREFAVGTLFGVQGTNTFLIRLFPQAGREPVSIGDLVEFRYGMDGDGRVRRAIVLEQFFLDHGLWIRALCHPEIEARAGDLALLPRHEAGIVYRRSPGKVASFLDDVLGVVQHGSDIGTLRFLHVGRGTAREGDLIQVPSEDGPVLYQVVNARVALETLSERNEADRVVGEAVQLGQWNASRNAFDRFGWVPAPRLPVTKARPAAVPNPSPEEIVLGTIPGTTFPVLMSRTEAVTHHTAVLGVTGAGKSVFTRALIRDLANDPDLRVVVVDFTREWKGRMASLGAAPMVDEATSTKLWQAIDVIDQEQAKFKNQWDQKLIRTNKRTIRDGFSAALTTFLNGDDKLRVFELPDVSQTEGVLEYTQWFFRVLFDIARKQACYGRRVCVVLEEAHTVIPEWNFIGIAEKSAQALVNNISQIALQGRKYGIGFVVIAQRTATVSKSVLTQCNTIIAFQCFDGTSIEFLSHYMPRAVAEALPNLRFRRAVAFGKAIRGSVPLMFDVPDIDESAEAQASTPEVAVLPSAVLSLTASSASVN